MKAETKPQTTTDISEVQCAYHYNNAPPQINKRPYINLKTSGKAETPRFGIHEAAFTSKVRHTRGSLNIYILRM